MTEIVEIVKFSESPGPAMMLLGKLKRNLPTGKHLAPRKMKVGKGVDMKVDIVNRLTGFQPHKR